MIYVARHVALGRHVAVKALRPELGADAELAARFEQEAKAASAIGHPHIVDVFDLGRTQAGAMYMVMELLTGRSLRTVLEGLAAGRPEVEAEYTLHRLVTVMERVCEAVHFAHERGVIHRDLKPENVMLGAFGEVHVMDWGIAKVEGAAEEAAAPEGVVRTVGDTGATRVGTLKGTLPYMSPEQASARAGAIDRRADVYALGVIWYQMIKGDLSAGRPGGTKWTKWLDDQGMPEDQIELLGSCFEDSPEDRPAHAAALAEQLLHGQIDVAAIGIHLAHRRPRQQPPPRPFERRAVGLVVGVEKMVVALVQRAVTRQERLQHEGLEEPGDMGQMPLRRAHVRHALDHMILGLQRLAKPLTGGAYALITLPELFDVQW